MNELTDLIYTVETVYYAVTAVIAFITGWFGKKKQITPKRSY